MCNHLGDSWEWYRLNLNRGHVRVFDFWLRTALPHGAAGNWGLWCPDVADILQDAPVQMSEAKGLEEEVPGTSQADYDEVKTKLATDTLPASTPIGKDPKFPPIYGMVRAVGTSKWNMCLRGAAFAYNLVGCNAPQPASPGLPLPELNGATISKQDALAAA